MNKFPLISIVTATFNAESCLPALIKSIRLQTYKNFEWIVVDGLSTDLTVDIAKEVNDFCVIIDSRQDFGIYDAWNRALAIAKGEWICFLGADDLIAPDGLQNMVNLLCNSPIPYEFISGRVDLFRGNVFLNTIGRPWEWSRFQKYMCVAHVGSLHNMSYFQKYGKFDISYKIAGDYEMLLRAGSQLRAGYVDSVIAQMQISGKSNTDASVFNEALRARLKYDLTTPFSGRVFCKWSEYKWRLRRLLGVS